jgi:hypothetical protein
MMFEISRVPDKSTLFVKIKNVAIEDFKTIEEKSKTKEQDPKRTKEAPKTTKDDFETTIKDYNSLREKIRIIYNKIDLEQLKNKQDEVKTNIVAFEKSNLDNILMTAIGILGFIIGIIGSIIIGDNKESKAFFVITCIFLIAILLSVYLVFLDIRKYNIRKIVNLSYNKLLLEEIDSIKKAKEKVKE